MASFVYQHADAPDHPARAASRPRLKPPTVAELETQRRNVEALLASRWAGRILPHRVDAPEKLKEVWRDGFRSFEVDVHFIEQTGRLQVGHDLDEMGLDLERQLQLVEPSHIQRIWLDMKNLTPENCSAVLQTLERLDAVYALKQKAIFESGIQTECLRDFASAHWHASYYMPTYRVLEAMTHDDDRALEELAESMARQVERQRVAAISFDARLYPFIKSYLEGLLPGSVVYHAWRGPQLWQDDFMTKLGSDPIVRDPRVKTLLVNYRSVHEL